MRQFKTEKRLNKITQTVKWRQPSLTVVLENIHDPHNVSAIYRSCDAVGIKEISLLYTIEKFPKIHKVSSASALKWVDSVRYSSVKDCYSVLREKGFKIYASLLDPDAKNLYDLDLTENTALVLGNENRGVSEEAAEFADDVFYIPMRGMIQSLNVSVATAVSLYEAQRQRAVKGMYDTPQMPDDDVEFMIDDWGER